MRFMNSRSTEYQFISPYFIISRNSCNKHFCTQTFSELEEVFKSPDGTDEFVNIHNIVNQKI